MAGRILISLLLLSLIGCTITKRYHRKGYMIEWNLLRKDKPAKIGGIGKTTEKINNTGMSEPTVEFKKVFKIQEPTQVMPNMNYVESADHIFHQTKPSPDEISRVLQEHKTVFRSRKLARPYWDDNTYETMQGVGWTFVVVGLFFFVSVLVFIGLNAGAGFTAISTFWGFVLLILFGLLGLLLTFIFGIIGAILFSMGIAAVGLLLVLISYIVLNRRHRFE